MKWRYFAQNVLIHLIEFSNLHIDTYFLCLFKFDPSLFIVLISIFFLNISFNLSLIAFKTVPQY